MKKITVLAILTLIATIFTTSAIAQDGYTYSLIHNNGYSFTIQAVPNASSNNFQTSMQSYGFTIIVPDGVTIDIANASSIGGAAGANQFDGTAVGEPTIDGYLITETLAAPINLPAPSAGTNSDFYTFTVNGNPTSGTMYILENNSTLANNIVALKSFLQADMEDDGMAQFSNRVDQNAPAVTAPSTYNFATLGTTSNKLENINIYPNPVKNELNIKGLDNELKKVSIYNVTGQKVISQTDGLKTINTSSLSPGVYFINLETTEASKTIKIVKE